MLVGRCPRSATIAGTDAFRTMTANEAASSSHSDERSRLTVANRYDRNSLWIASGNGRSASLAKKPAVTAGRREILWPRRSALAPQPHHHVDAGDLIALGCGWHLVEHDGGAGDVEQRMLALDEEMMVLGGVGVEVGFRPVQGNLSQQADLGELVQRVVDGRQRHRDLGPGGFLVEHFGGEMAVALREQEPAERHALTRRPQAHLPQHGLGIVPGTAGELGPRHRARPLRGLHGTGKDHFTWCHHAIRSRSGWRSSCPRSLRMRSYAIRGATCNSFATILFPPTAWDWRCRGLAAALPPTGGVLGERCMTIQSARRGPRPMEERRSSYEYEDLLACGRGELFGAGNAQLPLPPMLMFDRVSEIGENGGEYGRGLVRAVLDLKPDLWFFACHFKGDPVMPGCLGLDALWQLLGFFLGWLGLPGRGRALGLGELKFSGQVLPTMKSVVYGIDIRRVMRSKLVLGIGDGWLSADGNLIYHAKDLKVGLFRQDDAMMEPSGG